MHRIANGQRFVNTVLNLKILRGQLEVNFESGVSLESKAGQVHKHEGGVPSTSCLEKRWLQQNAGTNAIINEGRKWGF